MNSLIAGCDRQSLVTRFHCGVVTTGNNGRCTKKQRVPLMSPAKRQGIYSVLFAFTVTKSIDSAMKKDQPVPNVEEVAELVLDTTGR